MASLQQVSELHQFDLILLCEPPFFFHFEKLQSDECVCGAKGLPKLYFRRLRGDKLAK